MSRLIIEGNAVYEIDEECFSRRSVKNEGNDHGEAKAHGQKRRNGEEKTKK